MLIVGAFNSPCSVKSKTTWEVVHRRPEDLSPLTEQQAAAKCMFSPACGGWTTSWARKHISVNLKGLKPLQLCSLPKIKLNYKSATAKEVKLESTLWRIKSENVPYKNVQNAAKAGFRQKFRARNADILIKEDKWEII